MFIVLFHFFFFFFFFLNNALEYKIQKQRVLILVLVVYG